MHSCPEASRRARKELTLALAFIFASFLLLRLQLVSSLGLSWQQAQFSGFWIGLNFDLLVALLSLLLAQVTMPLLGGRAVLLWAGFALFAWLAALSNAAYVAFFGSQLDLWVVKNHWTDIAAVSEGSSRLLVAPIVLLSCLFLFAAFWLMRRVFPPHRSWPWALRRRERSSA